ncbi:hypothetical protein Dimus_014159 [Dionaea muscipula]
MVKHIAMDAIQKLYIETTPKRLAIADLGCSTGSNTLSIIQDLYHAVEEAISRSISMESNRSVPSPSPEFVVYLNDLPSNDFNSIFRALPEFHSELQRRRRQHKDHSMIAGGHGHEEEDPCIFVAAFPGSFYGRLFPSNSLNFVYSSYSLHWLSKVPCGIYDERGESINKGCIYISAKSPPLRVAQAYSSQFQEDFSLFLRLRSVEVKSGGRMVLIILGRESSDHLDRGNSILWELLTRSFAILISEGKVEKEKLDSYDVHFYAPCRDEVEAEVRKEGSFKLDQFAIMVQTTEKGSHEDASCGTAIAMAIRAIQESMIEQHFGRGILDSLFSTYAKLIDDELSRGEIAPITFALVLTKSF